MDSSLHGHLPLIRTTAPTLVPPPLSTPPPWINHAFTPSPRRGCRALGWARRSLFHCGGRNIGRHKSMRGRGHRGPALVQCQNWALPTRALHSSSRTAARVGVRLPSTQSGGRSSGDLPSSSANNRCIKRGSADTATSSASATVRPRYKAKKSVNFGPPHRGHFTPYADLLTSGLRSDLRRGSETGGVELPAYAVLNHAHLTCGLNVELRGNLPVLHLGVADQQLEHL